mmetsp:Transcript_32355/g.63241  ORF Transcript_32355/g.63241 Transcript_32355/m.63241 type:complete len:212 (-) Transcript_32355:540-1175(-)
MTKKGSLALKVAGEVGPGESTGEQGYPVCHCVVPETLQGRDGGRHNLVWVHVYRLRRRALVLLGSRRASILLGSALLLLGSGAVGILGSRPVFRRFVLGVFRCHGALASLLLELFFPLLLRCRGELLALLQNLVQSLGFLLGFLGRCCADEREYESFELEEHGRPRMPYLIANVHVVVNLVMRGPEQRPLLKAKDRDGSGNNRECLTEGGQ